MRGRRVMNLGAFFQTPLSLGSLEPGVLLSPTVPHACLRLVIYLGGPVEGLVGPR